MGMAIYYGRQHTAVKERENSIMKCASTVVLRFRAALLGALLLLASTTIASARGRYGGPRSTAETDENEDVERVVLAVSGMGGSLSAYVLESLLTDVAGVESAVVSFRSGRATIVSDPRRITPRALALRIEELTPYTATPLPEHVVAVTLRIPELETRKIGDQVNEVLSGLPGILGGTIRPGYVSIDYDEREISAGAITSEIENDAYVERPEVLPPPVALSESALAVIFLPDMVDYSIAARYADQLSLDGIVGATVDLRNRTIEFVYEIGEVTARTIETAIKEVVGEGTSLSTVDKADKPRGLNAQGWFVFLVSLAALGIALGTYAVIRRIRRVSA